VALLKQKTNKPTQKLGGVVLKTTILRHITQIQANSVTPERPTFQEKPRTILLIKQSNVVMKNAFLYLQYCEEQNCYDQFYIYIAKSDALQSTNNDSLILILGLFSLI